MIKSRIEVIEKFINTQFAIDQKINELIQLRMSLMSQEAALCDVIRSDPRPAVPSSFYQFTFRNSLYQYRTVGPSFSEVNLDSLPLNRVTSVPTIE